MKLVYITVLIFLSLTNSTVINLMSFNVFVLYHTRCLSCFKTYKAAINLNNLIDFLIKSTTE